MDDSEKNDFQKQDTGDDPQDVAEPEVIQNA